MPWVLDSSLALAWALPDETSAEAESFLEGLPEREFLWVPALWWYEIANGLAAARRKGRITQAECARLLQVHFAGIPVETDIELSPDSSLRLFNLAHEHRLTAYDAAYLELAQRRGLSLASLDERLCGAAKSSGVRIL